MSEICVSLDIRDYDATFEIEPLVSHESYRVSFGPMSINMNIKILEDLKEAIEELFIERERPDNES